MFGDLASLHLEREALAWLPLTTLPRESIAASQRCTEAETDAKLKCAVLIGSAVTLAASAPFVKSTEAGQQEPTTVNQATHKAGPPVCVPTQAQQPGAEAHRDPRPAAQRQ